MGRLTRVLVAAAAVVGTMHVTTPEVCAQQVPLFTGMNAARLGLGSIEGFVSDERGGPLAGAMVSALGARNGMAVTDARGRFLIDALPSGVYIVRVHLAGFASTRRDYVRVGSAAAMIEPFHLRRVPAATDSAADTTVSRPILAAGLDLPQPEGAPANAVEEEHPHGETAWRMRHLKRSVLKDSAPSLIDVGDTIDFAQPNPFIAPVAQTFSGLRAGSARIASALFTDFPVNGQINLLTRTSFDRPQDLLSSDGWMMPAGIAYVSLQAPTAGGQWSMRGAMTQGDLSSWIVSGAYVRSSTAVHQYETGMSYGTQRYLGGNADALAAFADGSRNVGALYAYDNWAVAPRITVNYGAKYERYDYLADRGQFSPRASITVTPAVEGKTKLRAMVSRRALAPGAEEFVPPSSGLWLPPERTFSPLSSRSGFSTEYVDHVELGAERTWPGDLVVGVRVFQQRVDDQLATLFGVTPPGKPAASVGHYYVASAGDFAAQGWGVSVSRGVTRGVRASADYRHIESTWLRPSRNQAALAALAPPLLRGGEDRFADLTTSIESVVPATDTRVFMIYKINTGLSGDGSLPGAGGPRFDVQINQGLPFLQFTSAQWEMLVAVRNLFREELLDASVYDELLVMRPPKRIIGGVTVRF